MGNFKLNLPIAIILASIILGGSFYAIQINKQESIEKQQRIEYVAKRKMDCYDTYQKEKKQYSNVISYIYYEPSNEDNPYLQDYNDNCQIMYVDGKTGENF